MIARCIPASVDLLSVDPKLECTSPGNHLKDYHIQEPQLAPLSLITKTYLLYLF